MLLSDLRMLGLARRAGKVAIGREAVRVALRTGRAKLLVLAHDAPEKVHIHFRALADACNVPVAEVIGKAELGHQVGRGPVAMIAVCEEQFARGILSKCAAQEAARKKSASASPSEEGTQVRNRPRPRRHPRRAP